jgi:signal transduction histidine kinase
MSQHLHIKIQHKFLIGLAAIFLLLGVIFLFALNMHLREMLHIEAEDNAEIVFSHLTSLQNYVRTTLRPAVHQALPPEEFLLEAMSTSFVTRKVLVDMNTQGDQYLYRRVALFPRNPASAANEMERGLISRFQEHPDETTYSGYRIINGVENYVMARPVHFDQECLTCHGDPRDAPRVLIERYGAVHGFGRRQGELAGLDFVGMPVDKSIKHIRESVTLFGGSFFAMATGVFLLISIFFNRLVVTNLRRLSAIFRENFQSPDDQTILDQMDEDDEINSLLEAFGAFASHLREARRQLEDYAANLESKVRRRTADLSRKADEHRTDVRLFVELLGDLNRSQSHTELLQSALPRIAQRFGAGRAAYLCAPLGRQQYVWPGSECESLMPRDWADLVKDGRARMESDRVFVPVSSSDWNRGLMGLFWDDRPRPEITPEVLLALGRQIGIALENMEAIDVLLRQNKLLELIFEGISDPMLLVDEGGTVILANPSAQALGEGIRPGAYIQTWLVSISASAVKDGALAAAIVAQAPSVLELELPGMRHLAVSVYPLIDSGDAGRAVVYIRETTNEKRMLARMQQSEKLSALGKLAAGLAHEINNPLGVIRCYAQLLQKSQLDAQAKEDLEVIVRHTQKAHKVLQDLLGLARGSTPASGSSDLGEVVRGMAQIFRVQVDKTGVALDLDLEPGLPRVAADASILEQILTNLLANAFDALPAETGRIVVSTRIGPLGRTVLLNVADNGPGIPPEHLGQIFDPFFTTKEIGKGTGLGLTVVHELMRELGGAVEVSGHAGAAFLLNFPVEDGMLNPKPASPEDPA